MRDNEKTKRITITPIPASLLPRRRVDSPEVAMLRLIAALDPFQSVQS